MPPPMQGVGINLLNTFKIKKKHECTSGRALWYMCPKVQGWMLRAIAEGWDQTPEVQNPPTESPQALCSCGPTPFGNESNAIVALCISS